MTDPELNLAFWLFQEHGVLPGQYYAMPLGEKMILRAFAHKISEVRANAGR